MASVIVCAGGTGTRMGIDGLPKQFVEVAEIPLIIRSMRALTRAPEVGEFVIVTKPQWRELTSEMVKRYLPEIRWRWAQAGETRQESILNGLRVVAQRLPVDDIVIVADAVRPLVSKELVRRLLDAMARGAQAAMPAVRLRDTVYLTENGRRVSDLIERDRLVAGQAPEAFRYGAYTRANEEATPEELASTSGSAVMAFAHGLPVEIVEGDVMNLKVTTTADLALVSVLLDGGAVGGGSMVGPPPHARSEAADSPDIEWPTAQGGR